MEGVSQGKKKTKYVAVFPAECKLFLVMTAFATGPKDSFYVGLPDKIKDIQLHLNLR